MSTFICMDGLGGQPETTFTFLKEMLEKDDHVVILVSVSGSENWSHRDRIERVKKEISDCTDKNIFLIGQSAGGSAVQIAADETEKEIKGVIAMSPALPRGYLYLTLPLLAIMLRWKNLWRILLGRVLSPTKREFESLASPLANSRRNRILESRQLIPGKEARELAFYPPKRTTPSSPTLIVFGEKDRWISPRALRKFAKQQKEASELVSVLEVKGSGHLTVSSQRRSEVVEQIKNLIKR